MSRTAAVLCLFGAAVVLLGVTAAQPASAERITMRYEIYGLFGIQVLELHTSLDEDGRRYQVAANYATTGIAGVIVPQSTQAVATGRLGPGTAFPDTFRNDTKRSGTERRSVIRYKDDGTVDGSSQPPPHNPVPAAEMRNTVDNLTAYLRVERQVATKGSCDMTAPVFDGRYRYDLVFSTGGRENLTPRSGQKFTGPAVVCRMVRHNRIVEEAEKNEGASQGTVWYATNLIPEHVVPVRMRLETQIGAVDAYLAELHGHGVDLKLIE